MNITAKQKHRTWALGREAMPEAEPVDMETRDEEE